MLSCWWVLTFNWNWKSGLFFKLFKSHPLIGGEGRNDCQCWSKVGVQDRSKLFLHTSCAVNVTQFDKDVCKLLMLGRITFTASLI